MPHDILFDTNKGTFIDAAGWARESDLDQTVLAYPEIVSRLLTGGDDYAITLAGAGHGGSQLLKIDALFLLDVGDAPPRLVIWESKREGNVHPRLLIGQVLDYASALAELSEEAFAQEITSRTSEATWRTRHEAAFRRRNQEPPDVAVIETRAREAHRDGRFTLVVCAEDLPPDVVRMAQWLTRQMAPGEVDAVAVELGPVGSDGWIRAAAVLHVVRGGVEVEQLDRQFHEAIARFQRLRSVEVVPVEAQAVQRDSVALSALSERAKAPRSSSGASLVSPSEWMAGAEPALRALHERLVREFPASIAEWNVGTSALLLYLKVGDERIEGLRLFGDRVYFVSEKNLLALGATEDARWWRATVAKFPVSDPSAKQPVVAGPKVPVLLEKETELMAFLHELRARAARAVGT